jgi:hypothetical protein
MLKVSERSITQGTKRQGSTIRHAIPYMTSALVHRAEL